MKINTSELTDKALDWAVEKLQNPALKVEEFLCEWERYNAAASIDWAQGGPIIEREKIGFWAYTLDEEGNENPGWYAETFAGSVATGPTPLIAAMRCYVASKLGDEVELPEEITE
jgi:hypothetical protein